MADQFEYWCCHCGAKVVTESDERPRHCGRTMKAHGREDMRDRAPHPMQPTADDGNDVLRFKDNAIVRHLLDKGPFDMNDLARLTFSREDREQFAQLIGYSVCGFGELGYVTDETYARIAGEDES